MSPFVLVSILRLNNNQNIGLIILYAKKIKESICFI